MREFNKAIVYDEYQNNKHAHWISRFANKQKTISPKQRTLSTRKSFPKGKATSKSQKHAAENTKESFIIKKQLRQLTKHNSKQSIEYAHICPTLYFQQQPKTTQAKPQLHFDTKQLRIYINMTGSKATSWSMPVQL